MFWVQLGQPNDPRNPCGPHGGTLKVAEQADKHTAASVVLSNELPGF